MLIQGKFSNKKNNSSVVATYDIKLSDTLSYKVSLIEPKDANRQFDILLCGSESDSDYALVMESEFYKEFLIPWINNKKEVSDMEGSTHDKSEDVATVINFADAVKRKNETSKK